MARIARGVLPLLLLLGCPVPDGSGVDDDDAADCVDEDLDGTCADEDCDDTDPDVRPGVAERTCDGVDNDCNDQTYDDPDADADGASACDDCDDNDPTASPLLNETPCDGVDNDCDTSTLDAPDADLDGYSVCSDDCDDDDPLRHPDAPPSCTGIDNDCSGDLSEAEAETAVGRNAACAIDGLCADLLAADPTVEDGQYWVGDDLVDPFQISCEFDETTGWVLLEPTGSQGVYVAEHSVGNPWHKCGDDSAEHFEGLTELDVEPDWSQGYTQSQFPIAYRNPVSGQTYGVGPVEFLRARVLAYDGTTLMVAVTSDDDNGDWDGGANHGHEVYVQGADEEWFNVTPGTNGECGGGSGWGTGASESAHYLWHPNPGLCAVDGDTGGWDHPGNAGLPANHLLPRAVKLVVQTGGGAAFGWATGSLRLR